MTPRSCKSDAVSVNIGDGRDGRRGEEEGRSLGGGLECTCPCTPVDVALIDPADPTGATHVGGRGMEVIARWSGPRAARRVSVEGAWRSGGGGRTSTQSRRGTVKASSPVYPWAVTEAARDEGSHSPGRRIYAWMPHMGGDVIGGGGGDGAEVGVIRVPREGPSSAEV